MVKCKFPDPPEILNYSIGGFDFQETGKEWLNLFHIECELNKKHRVLDIGSGCGRIAIPLAMKYQDEIEYEGLDIASPMVDWCQKNITTQLPNFRFRHENIYNGLYNSTGKILPNDFKFPYADNHFDIIIAVSVFTHLLPGDALHYLQEIKRVLKPNGCVLLTWHLMKDLDDQWGHYYNDVARTKSLETPEGYIAYYSQKVLGLLTNMGFKTKVIPGTWREDHNQLIDWTVPKVMAHQDITIMRS